VAFLLGLDDAEVMLDKHQSFISDIILPSRILQNITLMSQPNNSDIRWTLERENKEDHPLS
jgi:hypothetical protein